MHWRCSLCLITPPLINFWQLFLVDPPLVILVLMILVQNYQKSNTYSQTVNEFDSSFQGVEKFFIP